MDTVTVAELVRRAGDGDRAAWTDLTRRYVGLVHAVCRCFHLSDVDAAAVNQVVWLRTAEHLPGFRSPEAVGGWIAAAARGECLRVLRARGRIVHTADEIAPEAAAPIGAAPDAWRVAATDDPGARALLAAYAGLDAGCQRLLRLVAADVPASGVEIGAALDLPVDEIGPALARCLDLLRDAIGAGAPA